MLPLHARSARVSASVAAMLASGALRNGAIFNRTEDPEIARLRDRQTELLTQQETIVAAADADRREITVEERTQINALADESDRLEAECVQRQRVLDQAARLQAPQPRRSEPEPIPGDEPEPRVTNRGQQPAPRLPASPRAQVTGNFGFRNFGDFARSVRAANPRFGGEVDPRLIRNAAASTYATEATGADGGFLVPPDFRTEINQAVFGEMSIVGRTDRQRTSSNQITFPMDMTTPWGASGIQGYWVGEGQTKTQSKPAFEDVTVKANTLAVLVPVTEELLEDAPALDGYLRRKAPEVMDYKISDAIVRGNGVGKPLGILDSNNGALVTVSKESAQTADTINATNVLKMLARMPLGSRSTAEWLINPDAEVQLPLMTIGNQPMYLPPGGLRDNPYGSLLGRPVVPHQAASTVGDLGDIILWDPKQYLTLTKTGNGRDENGMRADVSIHLWFDQDLVAYRFTIRIGGQPWWPTYIAPANGSSNQSPYVVLEAR
jgi:HK97 family phage major capsid protein